MFDSTIASGRFPFPTDPPPLDLGPPAQGAAEVAVPGPPHARQARIESNVSFNSREVKILQHASLVNPQEPEDVAVV